MVRGTLRPLLAQIQWGQKGPRGQFIIPQSHVGPPEPVWAPKWPKTTLGPKLDKNHKMVINQSMASGNHQRPPDHLQERIPLQLRGGLLLPKCTPYSRFQEWCIYGIIYNYAPFLLSNPMGTLSGTNSMIPNLVPNLSPISKEDLSAISVWQFHGGYQKTIQGSRPPGPAGVGLSFSHKDYSQVNSQRLSIISIIVKASSTQHSLDNSIDPYR
ncbi:hypothetical protein O181_006129 [Austropuccinia psidii MF-1]|uniref:Uncharacterized protein n=1 Tax=Austropuccinia psidii MF-1 TaxID=1389203 RepID=A0A9Q3BJH0_9BASI|nr:hypothetical protein [Austropuccinia psidii MF-1]